MSEHSKTVKLGTYTQESWMNGWTSKENGVAVGTIRIIDGKLFYAYAVYKNFWTKNDVNWCRVTERQLQGGNKFPSERATQEKA